MGRPPLKLEGQKFGKLLVTGSAGVDPRRRCSLWICSCDCGTVETTYGAYLTGRKKTECTQCSDRRSSERMASRNHRHGMRGWPEYKIWESMRARCNRPTDPGYANYGGRGIRVSAEWNASFEAFIADMGRRPSLHHSLDREDVNGGYGPDNCRWATVKEQQNNRRSNMLVDYKGQQMTLGQAITAAGPVADKATVHYRLVRLGWPLERAVETPSPSWVRAGKVPIALSAARQG